MASLMQFVSVNRDRRLGGREGRDGGKEGGREG